MKKINDKILYAGKWLNFKEAQFINNGKKVSFEYVQGANGSKDVVIIVAKIIQTQQYVLIKQFRPAINDYVLSFPAGVCDSDDYKKDALRELKEETGYVGKTIKCSDKLAIFPGLIDTMVRICEVQIDQNDLLNQNPVQELEDAEEIKTILITKDKINDFIKNFPHKTSTYLWLTFNDI